MASPLDFSTAQSKVVSLLQASRTVWATSVDGSNQQYPSDSEIQSNILSADAEVCSAIINTSESPYISAFVQAGSPQLNGSALPTRNGVIVKVLCLNTSGNVDWVSGNVGTATNLITIGSNVVVESAGTSAANGVYTARGMFNGLPYYNLVGHADSTSNYAIYSSTPLGAWNLTNSIGTVLYTGGVDNMVIPWGQTWHLAAGSAPVPTVLESPVEAALVLTTGLRVRVATTGTLPSGLSPDIDYYIVVSGGKYGFATTRLNAFASILIPLVSSGTGTSTITAQYEEGIQAKSKDQINAVNINPEIYGSTWPSVCGWFFIEGEEIYTTSPYCTVIYADFALSTSPQAPEPYTNAVVAGAVANLLKDGSDAQMSGYYRGIFESAKQQIMSGAMVVPAITSYQGNQVAQQNAP